MAGFDTRRLTAAAFGIALVLGAGCPDPGSSCTGCTIKKVTYTIEPLPEGASINSIAMVEHIEMTGHCYDGSGTQPCVYTNTKVVNPTPTAAGTYDECLTQATDSDDSIRITMNVVLRLADGSTSTVNPRATVSGDCPRR